MRWLLVPTVAALLCAALPLSTFLAKARAPGKVRDELTLKELTRGDRPDAKPVHNGYFMPVGAHGDARQELIGRVHVPAGPRVKIRGGFPGFDADFFTHKGQLVPLRRGIIRGSEGRWDIILSPGRVWSEPADDGWSRASFPFVLAGRVWNDSHNGIATFMYKGTEVSALRVQIIQEAAEWARFDGWAQLPLSYTPKKPEGLKALIAAFEKERREKTPLRPWSALTVPAGVKPLTRFDGGARHVTASGLVVDGVLYAQPCRTRYGDYPYCREMRHGIYSVTKSMGAALSLLWLAHRYGEGVFDLKIADYLKITAGHTGWDRVTFGDVLNMMTGVGDNAPKRVSRRYVFEADEDEKRFERFNRAKGVRAKLDAAFSAGNYSWGPGEVGRYNTIQTFVLAAAMDAFLKSKEGAGANIWDSVVRHVLNPIGIPCAPMMHTREADGSRGVPILGWGYYATLGELAKIAQLLQARGAHQGRQLLDARKVKEIFSASAAPGYPIRWDNSHGRYRYHMSFWYMPYRARGGCFQWIPEMVGYGGNLVTLMPNGMTAIRLSDSSEDAPGYAEAETMADVADRIRPFCK